MKKKNRLLFLLFSILMTLFTVSCNTKIEKPRFFSNPPQKNIRINLQEEPFSLDPRLGYDRKCQIVLKSLFEGLTRIEPDNRAHLAAAASVDISHDQMIYTFTLKESKWSNGLPVHASDFEYAWKSCIAPGSNCTLASLFYPIKNAKAAKERRVELEEVGIETLNAKTLRVTLEHPAPYFLDLLANPLYSPVCENVDRENPSWSHQKGDQYVSNGPFQLADWKHDEEIVLLKNSQYRDHNEVKLSMISISLVKDPATALNMFEKGELDWVGDPFSKIPFDSWADLKEKGILLSHPIAGVYWIECNTERFPLNSPKLRRALALAIDRKKIVENLLPGQKIAQTFVPEEMSHLIMNERIQDNNIDLAERLLEESLDDMGIYKEELPEITLSYNDIPGQKLIAQAIQREWIEKLNIRVRLESADWNTYLDNLVHRKFDVAGAVWYSLYNDPIYNLEALKYKTNRVNSTGWEDTHYQYLLDRSDAVSDDETRHQCLRAAEKLLIEAMPHIPLFYDEYKYVKNPKVTGIFVSNLGQVDFKWATIEK